MIVDDSADIEEEEADVGEEEQARQPTIVIVDQDSIEVSARPDEDEPALQTKSERSVYLPAPAVTPNLVSSRMHSNLQTGGR